MVSLSLVWLFGPRCVDSPLTPPVTQHNHYIDLLFCIYMIIQLLWVMVDFAITMLQYETFILSYCSCYDFIIKLWFDYP